MLTEKKSTGPHECDPPVYLVNGCPLAIHNRKHYPAHSTFDVAGHNRHWHVVLLHRNPGIRGTLIDADEQTSSISIDMPPRDYDQFWRRLLGQAVPALVVKKSRADGEDEVTTIELAKSGDHNARL